MKEQNPETTCWLGVELILGYLTILFVTIYYVSRRGIPRHAKVYIVGSVWTGLWLIFGFQQPVWLYLKHRIWTAAPFQYPQAGYIFVDAHSVTALAWLVMGMVQPLLYAHNLYLHKLNGLASIGLMTVFLFSALLSRKAHIEPIHDFVYMLQLAIAAGVFFFYCGGLYSAHRVRLARTPASIAYWRFRHMDFMIATVVSAAGPGTFRVLRSFREMYHGRYDLTANPQSWPSYAETVSPFPTTLQSYQAMQNFYFAMAFLVVGVKLATVLLAARRLFVSFNWIFPLVPVFAVVLFYFIYHPAFALTFELSNSQ